MRQLIFDGKRILLLFSILITVIVLSPLSIAQQSDGTKRTYTVDKTVVPETVIEIVEARQLDGKNFPEDLELVVRNLSDKPIYGVIVASFFEGTKTGMSLYYGRLSLATNGERPTADDQPIKPGELGVLRVEPGIAKGTRIAIEKDNLPFHLSMKLKFRFQQLSFGDGTGYTLREKFPRKTS